MKRFCAMILALTLLMTGGALAAAKKTTKTAATEPPVIFDGSLQYTLSAKDTVLTVKLAGNAATGYTWSYTASEEALLKQTQAGYVPEGNPEGLAGAPGTFVLTFAAEAKATGEVRLTFEYMQPWEKDVASAYEMLINISKGGKLEVAEVRALAVADQNVVRVDGVLRYALNEDRTSLQIELASNPTTGYEWDYHLSKEDKLVEVTNEFVPIPGEDGSVGGGGTRFLGFSAAEKADGDVKLTLLEARPWEKSVSAAYEISISISETGELTVNEAEKAAPMLYGLGFVITCPKCRTLGALAAGMGDGGEGETGMAWTLALECPVCGHLDITVEPAGALEQEPEEPEGA